MKKTCGLKLTLGLMTVAIVFVTLADEAVAQRHTHHHHDAAGHMIDHAGHHIDRYGRQTGPVGLYHNQVSPYSSGYQQPLYTPSYGNTGVYYNQAPTVQQIIPQNIVPQNAIPYSMQANSTGMIANGTIKIFNPPDSGGEVRYTLNGTAYSIKPGYTQTVQNDRKWTVDFGSGGPAGNIRYSLDPGTYKFKVSEAGWNLFKSQDQTSIAEIPPAPIPSPTPIGNEPRPGFVPVD